MNMPASSMPLFMQYVHGNTTLTAKEVALRLFRDYKLEKYVVQELAEVLQRDTLSIAIAQAVRQRLHPETVRWLSRIPSIDRF